MESTLALVGQAITLLGPYWGWLSVVAVLATIGETLKRRIMSAPEIARTRWAQWWGRTLPLHPVAAGAVIGALPGVPLPEGVVGPVASVIYYAAAGVASTWAYDVIKTLGKAWIHDDE